MSISGVGQEMLDSLPARVFSVERRVTALEASCTECRAERREWERMVMKEIYRYRESLSQDIRDLQHKVDGSLNGLIRLLKAKPQTRKACAKAPKRRT